jgi:pyruvate dehydrogenase E2 component (dihydrolipoamide acetyltransferase)
MAMPDTAMTSQGKKGEVTAVELSRGARASARRAAEAQATIPHLRCAREIAPALAEGTAPTATLLAATGNALAAVPELNASYRDGRVERFSRVNLGFVVHTPDGVLMPTLFDADRATPAELAERLAELLPAAESGTLSAPALAGATCSVTVAADGVDALEPTIVPGQIAALAFGRIRRQPDGPLLTATLSCDERAAGLPLASRFLERLAGELEQPDPDPAAEIRR